MNETKIDIIHKTVLSLKKEVKELNNKLNTLLHTEYGVKDVAAELRVSDSLIYKLAAEELPYMKRGKFRVYKKQDVLDYKKRLEVVPAPLYKKIA